MLLFSHHNSTPVLFTDFYMVSDPIFPIFPLWSGYLVGPGLLPGVWRLEHFPVHLVCWFDFLDHQFLCFNSDNGPLQAHSETKGRMIVQLRMKWKEIKCVFSSVCSFLDGADPFASGWFFTVSQHSQEMMRHQIRSWSWRKTEKNLHRGTVSG